VGISGTSGSSGSSGSSGTSGVGTSGTSGTSGSSISGVTSSDLYYTGSTLNVPNVNVTGNYYVNGVIFSGGTGSGTSGSSGSSGTSGVGTSGTSGSSGSSGSSGTSGVGTSGTSGIGVSNITFLLSVGTILTTGTNKARVIIPYAATIIKAYATSVIAPVGSDAIFDITKNGVTIWTTQANRLKIIDGNTYGQQSSFDTTSLVEGDVLSIDVDQVGSTTPGSNVTVQLKTQI
jgi:hypothetical protein